MTRDHNLRLLARLILLVSAVICAPTKAADRDLYAIGNSLTASMLPFSIPGFANQHGATFNVGFHTQPGAALDFIVANPSTANITFPVTLDRAFGGYVWSDISVQPYPSATSTMEADLTAILSIVNSARSGASGAARLFIYSAWPSQVSFGASGFAAYWRSAVSDTLSQPTVLVRSYADHLQTRLAAALGNSTNVHVIPVGDVLAALDEQIQAGQVNGVTNIRQLYADNDHLGDVGKFIAGLTVYTTLFRRNPAGLSIPFGYVQGNAAAQLTPELAAQLEALVWRVVNTDPRAGVNSTPSAASQVLNTLESTPLAVTLGGNDREGNPLTFTVLQTPAHGRLMGQPPALTYTPDTGFRGADSFSFRVNDGWLDSAPAAVSIAVERSGPDPTPPSGGGGSLGIWWLLGAAGIVGRILSNRKMAATQLR